MGGEGKEDAEATLKAYAQLVAMTGKEAKPAAGGIFVEAGITGK